ncbi:MAG: glycosyltransferase family 2 protein, partial [Actinomycetes bacterium]
GGGGALYWSGAMRLAQIAARSIEPDFLVWLNDDVVLDADALARLLSAHNELVRNDEQGIVVGGVTDPHSGAISYAGANRPDRRRPTHFELVEPTDRLQKCDSMNGNLILIPEFVFRRLDGFDASFRHAMSDFDFGLRATAQGCGVWLAPGTFGTCSRDHVDQPWTNRDLTFGRRVRLLVSPKGLPPGDWMRFTRRHAGRFWPAYFASPYLRFAAQILQGK